MNKWARLCDISIGLLLLLKRIEKFGFCVAGNADVKAFALETLRFEIAGEALGAFHANWSSIQHDYISHPERHAFVNTGSKITHSEQFSTV